MTLMLCSNGKGVTASLVLLLTLMTGSAGALAAEPAFLNTAQMSVVRQQLHDHRAAPQTAEAYQHLLAAADSALNKPELSVTDKGMTPPGGSKHDYLSLSAYWWPDDSTPDGLPWVRKDGHVNPASKNDQSDGVRLADFYRTGAEPDAGVVFLRRTEIRR